MDSMESLNPEKLAVLKADLEKLVQTYGHDAVKKFIEASTPATQQPDESPSAEVVLSTESPAIINSIRRQYSSVFNEATLVKIDEWYRSLESTESAKRISDPAKIARLFVLKNLREVAQKSGLVEVRAGFERDADDGSDIIVNWESYEHGQNHARLQLQRLRTIFYIPNVEERGCVNDAIKLRNSFREAGLNNLETYSIADGKIIELPDSAM